jgi:galactose oxidase-like protein
VDRMVRERSSLLGRMEKSPASRGFFRATCSAPLTVGFRRGWLPSVYELSLATAMHIPRHTALRARALIAFALVASGLALAPTAHAASVPAQSWTQLSPSLSPSTRDGASMAYDPATGQLVLFGGRDDSDNAFSDTWVWNGSSWAEASTSGPSPGVDGSMAYDSGTGQLVLFGGYGDIALSDTWTWNGTGWVEQTPAASPPARSSAAMAYDPGTGQLFGGQDNAARFLNDTWVWEQQSTTTPRNTTAPSISGTSKAGKVLTCSTGTCPSTAARSAWSSSA